MICPITMTNRRGGNVSHILSKLLIAATATFSLAASAAENWDMAYAWPESNFVGQNGLKFAEQVNEVTEGRLQITIHSGGALGLKGPETMGAIRDGIVPIAEYTYEQQVGEIRFAGVSSLPSLAD